MLNNYVKMPKMVLEHQLKISYTRTMLNQTLFNPG